MKWFDKLFKKGENGKSFDLWYVLIILAIGVILFSFANRNITESNVKDVGQTVEAVTTSNTLSYEERLEKRLEETLSQMDGAGEVKILLTIESSKEIVVNKDNQLKESNIREEDSNGGNRSTVDRAVDDKTIMVNKTDGSTEPIVIKENMPIIEGVLILSEYGDNPKVRERLTRAAEILLDIPVHKIEVYKMK